MQFNPDADYKKLITDLIQKQIVVLGPSITLAKARNVKGLTIDDSGNVMAISVPPQKIIQGIIDQFVQLSGLIVKKTMEPLLAGYPDGITMLHQESNPQQPTSVNQQVNPAPQASPISRSPVSPLSSQPFQSPPSSQPIQAQTPQPTSQPTQVMETNQNQTESNQSVS